MTITLRAGTTSSFTSSATFTVNKPSGTLEDDTLFAQFYWAGTQTLSAPDGTWSLVAKNDPTALNLNNEVWMHVVEASAPASWSFTLSGSVAHQGGSISYYSSTADPIAVDTYALADNTGASSTSHVASGVTTANANEQLLTFCVSATNASNWTAGGGMTERYEFGTTHVGACQDEAIASAGATGTRTHTTTNSVQSKIVTVAIMENTGSPPVAPSGLTATAFDDDRIDLAWTDNSGDEGSGDEETGFEVERSPNGSTDWANITTTAADAESYSNTGLTENTTYYYRVRAVNASGNSSYTSTASATTYLTAPTALTATAITDVRIDLAWTINSAVPPTGTAVERSPNGSTGWTQIATVAHSTATYSDTGLTPETAYYYRIRSYLTSPSNYSLYTSTATDTTGEPPVEVRPLVCILGVDWDQDTTYTEEDDQLISARGSIRIAPPNASIATGSGIIAQASFELDNSGDRYSPLVTTGPIYSAISGGKMYRTPMYFQVSIDGGSNYDVVFTGLMKIPQMRTLAPGQPKVTTFDCRGNEEQYINYRLNTAKADFATWHDEGRTEGELIAEILADAGVAGGDMSIDTGLFNVPWFWMDEASVIETCWQLAGAGGGRFYCNRDGEFRYEDATHWLSGTNHTTSQATFTRADYANLAIYYDDDNLASKVVARAHLYEVGTDAVVWEAESPVTVPADSEETVIAEVSAPAYVYTTITYTAQTPGGVDMSSHITMDHLQYAQRVPITFTNDDTTRAVVIKNLQMTGTLVSESESVAVEVESADSFWTAGTRATASLAENINNPWIQDSAQAKALAQMALDRMETPPLFYRLINVAGDPAREIGDRITINDNELMSAARDAFVIGIDWRYSGAVGFRQDLLAIDAAAIYQYSDSDPGYFIIGTNKLGAADALRGRVFY